MIICEGTIKRGVMTKERPCILFKGHGGRCSPDLTGVVFGTLKVLSKGKSILKSNGQNYFRWNVLDKEGQIRLTGGVELTSGKAQGRHAKPGFGYCELMGKIRPEYSTVKNHYRYIFTEGIKRHENYVGMPFYNGWNPNKGGSWLDGAKWIIDNLGSKPSLEWSIDIIEHDKGFVPGNLRWALKKQQLRNQRHKKLGQFTDEEFAVEAFRRGYTKVNT